MYEYEKPVLVDRLFLWFRFNFIIGVNIGSVASTSPKYLDLQQKNGH